MTLAIPPEMNKPSYQSAVVRTQVPDLTLVRDVASGTRRIREKTTTYLPQHPKESKENYLIRLMRPVFFNAFQRTEDGLVGMVFREDPQIGDDVPKSIVQHWENIDKRGTHGDVFLRTVFADALEAGHAGILVDYPQVKDPTSITLATERALDLRPYWVHIKKEDIINFRTVTGQGGELVLQQVTLRFCTFERQGEFGDQAVVRYRVYRNGPTGVTWELWEENDKQEPALIVPATVIPKLTAIPFTVVYGRQTGYLQSVPPLLDLANLNVLHYQTNSDYFHALHIACVPVFVVTGTQDQDIVISPNAYVSLPQGATAGWEETSGAAPAAARTAINDIEGQMAVIGLSLLQPDTRMAETAEAKRLDKSEKDSALSVAARGLQDGTEAALGFHAQYLGEQTGGSVIINRDFGEDALSADDVRVLGERVATGQLSLETLWAMMEEGEWLPDDFDPDVEKDRLEQSGAVMGAQPPKEEGIPA